MEHTALLPRNPNPSACDARPSGLAPQQCAAFTLIEVLVAMVIFAIGFAMVAGVVPAGHLLNRQAEDDVLAAIAGRNAGAAVEAGRIYAPAFEYAMMHGGIAGGAYSLVGGVVAGDDQASANGGQAWALDGPASDFEKALIASPGVSDWPASWATAAPYGGTCPGWAGASPGFRFFADANGDGNATPLDATDLTAARIHVYNRRPGWSDAFPGASFSYPDYTPTVADRPYQCTLLAVDSNANPFNRRWVGLMAVLRRHGGELWPERASGHAGGGRAVLAADLNNLQSQDTGNKHPNNGSSWSTYAVGTANDRTPDPSIPGLYCLPMIVYDFNQNLVEAQYPDCWAPLVSTDNPSGIDRRLKPGDLFIARESGTAFTVVSTRDAPAPGSPGTILNARTQLLEVYPPLRTTLLNPNASTTWSLRAGFFAPPPSAGGASPLIRVETIPATRGFTANPNQ